MIKTISSLFVVCYLANLFPLFANPADGDSLTLSCPPEIYTQCPGYKPQAYTSFNEFINAGGTATSVWNINVSAFRLLSEVTDGISCPETITRTYEITDTCGNVATCEHIIKVGDTIPPGIYCVPQIDLKPYETIPAPYNNFSEFINDGGIAYDNCEVVESSFSLLSQTSGVNGDYQEIIRTYQISDACGNTSSCTHLISILQNMEIEIICPPSILTQCQDPTPQPYGNLDEFINAGGYVTSICGINLSTFALLSEASKSNSCPETITRTYSIVDSCGATVSCIQNVNIDDDTPPTFISIPANIITSCSVPEPYENYYEFRNAGGEAMDNCSLDTLSFTLLSETDDSLNCPRTIQRIYGIYDDCGNRSAFFTQTITINDRISPVLTCPRDTTVNCIEDLPVPDSSFVLAIDNCGIGSIQWINDVSYGNSCPKTVIRTYRATDQCGNTSVCKQMIMINDTIPPALTCPPDTIVECMDDLPTPSISLIISFDDCGPVRIYFTSDYSNGKICPETVTRTYRATDQCGNTSECLQMIIINDTIPPDIICPPDTLIQITSEDISIPFSELEIRSLLPAYPSYYAFINDDGTAVDNCSIAEDAFILIQENAMRNDSLKNTSRIYSISDNCGNVSTFEHSISIQLVDSFASGIENVQLPQEQVNVDIFPNPNKGEFQIKINGLDHKEFIIEVYNNLGYKVFNKEVFNAGSIYEEQVNLKEFSSGTYIVKIITASGEVIKKVVVQ